jgi:hypothetical protein
MASSPPIEATAVDGFVRPQSANISQLSIDDDETMEGVASHQEDIEATSTQKLPNNNHTLWWSDFCR